MPTHEQQLVTIVRYEGYGQLVCQTIDDAVIAVRDLIENAVETDSEVARIVLEFRRMTREGYEALPEFQGW